MIVVAQFKGRSLLSKSIRFVTRSPYSHTAFMRIPSIPGKPLAALTGNDGRTPEANDRFLVTECDVIEAWHPGGVRHVASLSTDHKPDTEVRLYTIDATYAQCSVAWQHALQQLGKKYDFLGVAGFLSRRQSRDRARSRWFCSELVFSSLQAAGVELLREIEPHQVPPAFIPLSPRLTYIRTVRTI